MLQSSAGKQCDDVPMYAEEHQLARCPACAAHNALQTVTQPTIDALQMQTALLRCILRTIIWCTFALLSLLVTVNLINEPQTTISLEIYGSITASLHQQNPTAARKPRLMAQAPHMPL